MESENQTNVITLLTAEQVREAIERHVKFYEGGDYDEQAIADELNEQIAEFAGRIAALGSDRESELQSALNKAAGNWAKADALLRERTSGSEAANPQIRCTDSKRNAPVRDGEDSHTLLPCPFCGGEAKAFQHGDVGHVVQCRRCGIWNAGYHAAWSHITEDEFIGFIDEESAVAAWNTRACGQCEGGAVQMTEENMAAHGWVRERTCRPSGDWKSISQTQEVRHVTCSECGHEFGMERRYTIPFERTLLVELPNFCPNCGAKVMGA